MHGEHVVKKTFHQTPRYRWIFYKQINSTDVDAYGKPDISYLPVVSGLFALEVARKPIEILDGSAVVSELQYVLAGAYIDRYRTIITNGMIAWCPALDKVVEILGLPVDDKGERLRIIIYVTDNVERVIDTSTLGVEFV